MFLVAHPDRPSSTVYQGECRVRKCFALDQRPRFLLFFFFIDRDHDFYTNCLITKR